MTKKVLSTILALVMVLGLLPAAVYATEPEMLTLEELRSEYGAITIEAYNIGQGFLVEPTLYAKEGKSVGDITVELLANKGISYQGSTSYFSGLEFDDMLAPEYPEYLAPYLSELEQCGDGDGYLAEFDYSMYAGWCFTINDWWSSWGADSAYPGKDIKDYNTQEMVTLGDVIRWHFTVYGYGADCGFPGNVMAEFMGGNLFTQEDKSDLIFILAAINDYYGNLDDVYETALAVAADPLATADEIAAQEAILTSYINETFFDAQTEEELVPDEGLELTMNISVGAELQVMYTVLNARVKNFESFYVEVVKDVVGGESMKTVFSLDNGNMDEISAPNGNLVGYTATYTGIFAMEMGDNFTATLYAVAEDGTVYYGDSESSSIKSYLMEKLADSTSSDELKTLAVDMLNYGAAAQVNFNYDAENLVNADLTDEQKLLGTQETPSATDSSATSGDGGRITTSVSLQSKVLLYVNCNYAKTENSNLEFVVKNLNGDVLERFAPTVAAAKMCQGVYGNVGARQMRDLITIELYDNGKLVSQTLTWNIESYVAQTRANSASSDALIATVNAMLTYGDSAAAYLAVSGQ